MMNYNIRLIVLWSAIIPTESVLVCHLEPLFRQRFLIFGQNA